MVTHKNKKWFVVILVITSAITACSQLLTNELNSEINFEGSRPIKLTKTPVHGAVLNIDAQSTPVEADSSTLFEQVDEEEPIIKGENDSVKIWIDPAVSLNFENSLAYKESKLIVEDTIETANTYIILGEKCTQNVKWVYALVAPFPTWQDGVSLAELESLWRNGGGIENGLSTIYIKKNEYKLFTQKWGEPDTKAVKVVEGEVLLDLAWNTAGSVAIIPFEELEARWKVLEVDNISPIDEDFDSESYSLTVSFCLTSSLDDEIVNDSLSLPETNYDESKMTSVVMTGVTALVRATASQMEIYGVQYPGEKIYDWMVNADFTHVSNEVAFAESCPYPNPYQTDLRFCSDPKYMELLQYLDVDVIELTGNHIQDWSNADFVRTLDMYEANGIAYYAGGRDINEAKEPLVIEHNGNKLVFLGCNAVGPYGAFATATSSGNPPCGDYEWLLAEVREYAAEGYLPIVTLQHNEFYSLMVTGPQIRDFTPISEAGAVVVSGSQAHYPNPFGFVDNHFIHYGLGNLFFDQMDAYIADGIQREFIDRHIFYNGRYISTHVYTAYLENFAQPRPMTSGERQMFLQEAFIASGWK